MKVLKGLTAKEKAIRFDVLARYVEHWPYSPYNDIEMRELEGVVRSIVGKREEFDG